jgi:hypothetical protein
MSDEDDLLPDDTAHEAPGGDGFAEQLGGVFGGTVMIAALFVVIGVVAYLIATLMH